MMKTYNQLTYEQRCQISILIKTGSSQQKIADAVGASQGTISRELRRNAGGRGYREKQAHNFSQTRRKSAKKATKMTVIMIALIKSKLEENWSPEQISGWLLEERGEYLSYETIYLYIWENKKLGGSLFCHLRRKGKAYQPRGNKHAGRGCIKNRVSIDERPDIVDEKTRVGDWEIDLVIGKGHSGALVTIVERKMKFTVSKRINDKSAETVTLAAIALLKPFKDAVLTITADNGKEFAYHERIAKALDAKVYFADPYSSWQRGLNENTNGLLRQYWPKLTDFKTVDHKEVSFVIQQLNERPRKILNYETPAKLMAEHMALLGA